jgi:hypothetical protein
MRIDRVMLDLEDGMKKLTSPLHQKVGWNHRVDTTLQ